MSNICYAWPRCRAVYTGNIWLHVDMNSVTVGGHPSNKLTN